MASAENYKEQKFQVHEVELSAAVTVNATAWTKGAKIKAKLETFGGAAGQDGAALPGGLSTAEVANRKFFPVTSTNVERTFSMYQMGDTGKTTVIQCWYDYGLDEEFRLTKNPKTKHCCCNNASPTHITDR